MDRQPLDSVEYESTELELLDLFGHQLPGPPGHLRVVHDRSLSLDPGALPGRQLPPAPLSFLALRHTRSRSSCWTGSPSTRAVNVGDMVYPS